ncbi:hypothetical protein TUMSATVNIG1_60460 (plasmid) [Vibrio nigripulchritudo]|nr:hypothetical protein VNTUMSATTG_59970 [Vibrio nigripulchritudo]BDU35437.1 hypothetical protein TUMSATVNIG1_60460 [Vibrio nigripulchritudo]
MNIPKIPSSSIDTPKFISENAELFSGLFFILVALIFGLLVYCAFKLIDALAEKVEK